MATLAHYAQLQGKPMPIRLNPKEIAEERSQLMLDAQTVSKMAEEEDRDLTPDEAEQVDQLMAKVNELEEAEKRAEKFQQMRAKEVKRRAADQQMYNQINMPGDSPMSRDYLQPIAPFSEDQRQQMQAKARQQQFRLFGPAVKLKRFEKFEDAYNCGMWMKAVLLKDRDAVEHCQQIGWNSFEPHNESGGWSNSHYMQQVQTIDAQGGYLVPTVLAREILKVVDENGICTQLARVYPMSSEKENVPKHVSGLTIYKPGSTHAAPTTGLPSEPVATGDAITVSNSAFIQVQLIADDAYTLTQISNKLMRSNVVSAADQVVEDAGLAIAEHMDYEFIAGDGVAAAPAWGRKGLLLSLGAAGKSPSGAAWSAITAAHISTLIGLLPDKYHRNASFICSRGFFAQVLEPLMESRAGSKSDMGGTSPMSYRGYPIYFTHHMPTATPASGAQTPLLFGDFRESVLFGDRQRITIAMSEHRYFELDAMAIRAGASWDIKVHRPGDGSDADGYVGLTVTVP